MMDIFDLGQDQLLDKYGMNKTRVCVYKQPDKGQPGQLIISWLNIIN